MRRVHPGMPFTITSKTKKDPQLAFLMLCRHELNLSRDFLGKLDASTSGYLLAPAGDEMTPSIDTAKKLAALLNTTVGYLLGETEQDDFLKDPAMIQRLKELSEFSDAEKEQVFFNMDAIIREIKNRRLYSKAS